MFRKMLVRKVGLPIAERLKGWSVSKYLREVEDSQWWPAERIREYQNDKIAQLIDHAYSTVPFYKRVLDERGLTPADIRTVEDLRKLPILTKEDIRSHIDEMVSSKFDISQLAVATSSGSTGEPFRYYISQDEKARKWAALYLLWEWAGYDIGDRYINFVAGAQRAFKANKLLGWLEAGMSGARTIPALDLYQDNAHEFLREFARFKPRMIRGYSSSLYYLAQVVKEHNVDLRAECLVTTGETLYDFQRELMESVFGCKVYDGYGGEGMVIAGQCGHSTGYHINSAGVVVEIVDNDGNPCPAGTPGQVVLTDLNHYSMPFIRYNIQDIATLSDEVCNCGRELPMLSSIMGRLTDVGVTPSGRSIIVHFFTIMFMKLPTQVRAFQVVQEKIDHVVMNVVPGPGFEDVREDVLKQTREYLGPEVNLELRLVDDIPLTSAGKRRLLISKCGPSHSAGNKAE